MLGSSSSCTVPFAQTSSEGNREEKRSGEAGYPSPLTATSVQDAREGEAPAEPK